MELRTAARLALAASLAASLTATAAPAPKASPSPGPLGVGRLAYDVEGVIKVLDLSTGKTESYDLPERLELASWGADGQRFLYNSDFGASILDIPKQSFTSLTPPGQKAFDPAWSPDEKRMLFEVREKDAGLYVYDFADKKQAKIPLALQGSRQPGWHPDGQHIVFTAPVDGVDQVFTLDLACTKDASCDKAAVQLTKGGKGSRAAAYSADGTRIALERDEGKGPGIAVMLADGTGLKRLSPAGASDHNPAWGGSDQIAFERDAAKAGAGNSLWMMKADGTGAKALVKPETDKDGKVHDGGHNPNWWVPKK